MDKSRRYYLLDVLRGFASLSVVVWHYQHFFYEGRFPTAAFSRTDQPFYWLLAPLYTDGGTAVLLFFSLSGFIFFGLYSEAIKSRKVSGKDFFVLRFSRLYPLHFITLLAVALLEPWYTSNNGIFWVSEHNDLKHFVLQLFFASHWGLEDGFSFNAPVWSVSIEVLLYFFFFMLMRSVNLNLLKVLLIVVVGAIIPKPFQLVRLGVVSFFLGGAACLLYESLNKQSPTRKKKLSIVSALALSAVLALWLIGSIDNDTLSTTVRKWVMQLWVFPALVFALAVIQDMRHQAGARVQWIGDITYATYLIHFPLQLSFLLVLPALGLQVDYYNPVVFLSFFAALIAISLAAYYRFERPMQRLLRKRFMPRARSPLSPAPARAEGKGALAE